MCQNRPKVFQGSLMSQFRFNNQGVAKWTSLFSEQTSAWQRLWPCHQPVPGNIHFVWNLWATFLKVPPFSICLLLSMFLLENFINYFLILNICFLFGFCFLCTIMYGIYIKYVCVCLFIFSMFWCYCLCPCPDLGRQMEISVIKCLQKLHPNVVNRWREQITCALSDFMAGGGHTQ